MNDGPLKGVRVTEFTTAWAGPYASCLLGFLLKDRGTYTQVDHPEIGKDWAVNPPWKLSETPASIRRHAPLLGEHNEYVFCELLGMSADEVADLEAEQVIY